MDTNIIRLTHFYDKKAYCRLQEYFGSHDYKRNYEDRIDKPLEDLTITYHEFDEFSLKEDWKELKFEKDFLISGINNLSKNYIDNFNKEINEKGLFTKDLLDGFGKHYRNRLNEIKKEIANSNFIKKSTKIIVIDQAYIIEDYVEGFFNNPYPNIKNKIQVNWNRTNLIYFFHLIRENKQIAWIEDNDLGRIIDSVFEYQDPKNKEKYISCINTRKHFTAFKNNDGRPQNKANEELKKIFTNEDFYNV